MTQHQQDAVSEWYALSGNGNVNLKLNKSTGDKGLTHRDRQKDNPF